MTVPSFLPYYTVGGSLAIIAAIVLGLNGALKSAGWSGGERSRAVLAIGGVLTAWFALAVWLARLDVYHATADGLPTVAFGIFIPIAIGALALARSQTLARIVAAVPQTYLVSVQFYRALGAIFLILWAGGLLPGLFAWPAGAGDVAVGLAAPFVAMAYARSASSSASVAWWNVLGLADLVVAVGTGVLTSPSPFQLFAFDNPNVLVSIYPLVLVPTFLVPVSVLMHFASLQKLAREDFGTDARCDLLIEDRSHGAAV